MTKEDLTKEEYGYVEKLLTVIEASGRNYDIDKILRAYLCAKKLHEGQKRNSGEPYIVHPVAVAEIALSLGLDTDSICAAFLHDTIEDCSDRITLDELRREFGPEVAMLVDGLTKMADINIEDKEEAHMENIRKMLLAMSKDIRVIFIKLCDRLHNMRTLDAKPENKRRITALETMHVYAPLAHRLGMQRVKQELENLALGYLDPIGYEEVSRDIEKKYGQNRDFIEKVRSYISEKLDEYKINYTLEGRVKTVYSIYRKMFNQNKSFDEIYDFYALRIIVDNEIECYTALGIIHELFKSIPGRFKDYISTPKPNMYQSLHTTVIGRDGIPFEVQIRTKEMHHIAEYGIAAHWKYKSGERSREEIDKKLEWISKLVDTENDTVDHDEFMNALKNDIFNDETFVFTPKGDVIALPQGSTIIDFAYAIHSEVGNKMIGAKINGMIVPIDKIPQNGEIVEILTSSASHGPSRDWLKIVRTSEAKSKIRNWFKKMRREENIQQGRDALARELRREMIFIPDDELDDFIGSCCRRLRQNNAEELYAAIGYGGITIANCLPKLKEEWQKLKAEEGKTEQLAKVDLSKVHATDGVVVEGFDNTPIKFAKCCSPLPGDPIVGFITRGFGVSIHKQSCANAISSMKDPTNAPRWVKAYWADSVKDSYKAGLEIVALDRNELLRDVLSALADIRVPIYTMNARQVENNCAVVSLTIGINNTEHLNRVVARLSKVKDVLKVTRS